MLVAIRTFAVRDDRETRLIAGISRVDEGHEIARRYPGCFQPVPGEQRAARDRIYAGGTAQLLTTSVRLPSEPRHLEPWRLLGRSRSCRVGSGQSPTGVRLAAEARTGILAELERSHQERETGGILYGGSHPTLIEVLAAADAGPQALRENARFRFDAHWCRESDRAMAARGFSPVGEWHSHPNAGGAPSIADLEAWHERGRAFAPNAYLGMIAARLRHGFELVPWIVAGGVCRRGRL